MNETLKQLTCEETYSTCVIATSSLLYLKTPYMLETNNTSPAPRIIDGKFVCFNFHHYEEYSYGY